MNLYSGLFTGLDQMLSRVSTAISRATGHCSDADPCSFSLNSEEVLWYTVIIIVLSMMLAAPVLWKWVYQRYFYPRIRRNQLINDLTQLTVSNHALARQLEQAKIELAQIQKKWNTAFGRFTSVDVETTGLKAAKSRILQIAVVLFNEQKCVGKRVWFINPGRSIPINATKVNNITNDMIADKPTLSEIATEIQPLLERYPIVGHNIKFDYEQIKEDFNRCGIDIRMKISFCTMTQKFGEAAIEVREKNRAAARRRRWLKLAELASQLNVKTDGRYHDAFVDARVAGECFIRMAAQEVDAASQKVSSLQDSCRDIEARRSTCQSELFRLSDESRSLRA